MPISTIIARIDELEATNVTFENLIKRNTVEIDALRWALNEARTEPDQSLAIPEEENLAAASVVSMDTVFETIKSKGKASHGEILQILGPDSVAKVRSYLGALSRMERIHRVGDNRWAIN